MAGEFRELANLGEQSVEQPRGRAWQDKPIDRHFYPKHKPFFRYMSLRNRDLGTLGILLKDVYM